MEMFPFWENVMFYFVASLETTKLSLDLTYWCLYRHLCILPERFGKIDLWIANLISVYRKRRNVVTTLQTPVVSMTTRLIK